MRKSRPVAATVLFVAGCTSPVTLNEVARADETHRLVCRARVECPQYAAQLCPAGYDIVDGALGPIGALTNLTISCR